MYDIIIIGAGPAGLTAALYALRANKKVLVLEAKSYGGQILTASKVENYPGIECISGADYAEHLFRQVEKLGLEIRYETVYQVLEDKTVKTRENEYHGEAVIIATGATHRRLEIEGEEDFIGKGVSYCATCDGNFYKGKEIVVIGGGNSALEDAIYLADIASKVYLIHRRNEFRGEHRYIKELKNKDNVEFILNSTIESIKGNNVLKQVIIKDDLGNTKTLNVSGLFIAIGQVPKNEIFHNVCDIDENGYIIALDGVHTKTVGIYVAGDTRQKFLRQLTTAVGDGSVAATVAMQELNRKEREEK